MFDSYEINNSTLAIVPINSNTSKVIEENETYLVRKSTTEIIDDSCRFFGSSYLGRHEGTKTLMGINYKSPIIVEESKEIIFFPTSSPRFDNCYWIALDKVKNHQKSNVGTLLKFNNGYEIDINISSSSLENQILRATKLGSILRKRKIA
jgi:competence protein ComK